MVSYRIVRSTLTLRNNDMYKAKKPLSIMNPFSFGKYQSQILSLIGFMILSLVSVSSHALVLNDGAAATCPSGSTKGI